MEHLNASAATRKVIHLGFDCGFAENRTRLEEDHHVDYAITAAAPKELQGEMVKLVYACFLSREFPLVEPIEERN
ncbi:hypothetical protein [Streptomyces sp. C10]|uniref:hypothetical protein n=1 Tax=Streptomyces sp. C10 TaxID=531941 RepID=UPI00398054DB